MLSPNDTPATRVDLVRVLPWRGQWICMVDYRQEPVGRYETLTDAMAIGERLAALHGCVLEVTDDRGALIRVADHGHRLAASA